MPASYRPARRDLEEALLDALSPEAPWSLIEHFANENWIRESGSEDERKSAQYISEQLTRFGVEHTVHTPELFLSVPVRSRASPAGANSTPRVPLLGQHAAEGLTGEAIFIPDFNASARRTSSISSRRRRMSM